MPSRARAYQEQVTGRPATQSYLLDGVKFDGYKDGVLLEAKGPGYGSFVKDGKFADWFQGENGLIDQAQRQFKAANGTPIEWHVADESAVSVIRERFSGSNLESIKVVYTPLR